MIVYQAHNHLRDTFYVGKTIKSLDSRRRQHFVDAELARNNSLFHKAIRKYGAAAFDWCILHVGSDLQDINAAEIAWIKLIGGCGHRLYNLRPGGDGGSLPGKLNHKYGKALPDAAKAKISAGLKKHYSLNPGTMTGAKGEASPFYGKHHSEESKVKISQSKIGRARPSMLGVGNPSARQVVCKATGEVFLTATDAALKYDCDLSSIIKCCKGRVKTVKGQVFAYAEPGVYGWTQL